MGVNGSPVASVSGVSKEYPGGVTALHELDLEFGSGSVTAVIGANGSGKTSLLRILAGRLEPSTGEVRVFGATGSSRPANVRRRLGFVSQELSLDGELTGRETLCLFAALHGLPRTERRQKIDRFIEGFELGEHAERRVDTYSGGLRRRLHVALGLLHEPDLMLLDEPSAGIDGQGREALWHTIGEQVAREKTAVIVTHDLLEAEKHADRAIVLDGGKLVASGPPAALVAEHAPRTLEVKIAEAPDNQRALVAALETLLGVREVKVEGRQLSIETDAVEQDLNARVVARLEAEGAVVLALELKQPSLALAYQKLTGNTALSLSGSGERRRRSGRKRGKRS